MYNTLKHSQFANLLLTLQRDKATMTTKIERGASITELAAFYKVPQGAFKTACESLGIALRIRAVKRPQSPLLISDMLTVLARIAQELNVEYGEIKPYLNPASSKSPASSAPGTLAATPQAVHAH